MLQVKLKYEELIVKLCGQPEIKMLITDFLKEKPNKKRMSAQATPDSKTRFSTSKKTPVHSPSKQKIRLSKDS